MKGLIRSALVQRLLAFAVGAYARLLAVSVRWEVEGRDAAEAAVASERGFICLFWHGRISQAMACRALLGGRPVRVMISLSRDGAFISRAAERMGVGVIRGSTGRGENVTGKGGGAAFRQAVESLKQGFALLLTPDGPRGPREVLSLGAVKLAVAAQAPVFLAGFAARPSIAAGSWDAARLPLPFARGRAVIIGPLSAARGGADALQRIVADWQARLDQAQARAEDGVAGGGKSSAAAMTAGSPALATYRTATTLAAPMAPLILAWRTARGREDPTRRAERLGRTARARPVGDLVWLHGASVGEALCLLPLMEALAKRPAPPRLLVTSGTPASAEILAERLPVGAIHQYAPIDTPGATARFMRHWRPRAAVFAESDLWPNLLLAARRENATIALVSARLSAASARRWRWAPGMVRKLFGAFALVLAKDADEARRIVALGGRVAGLADFKFGAPPLSASAAALDAARAAIGGRALVLAASTHPGEEAVLLDAWRALAAPPSGDRPLLILAPRHPTRAPEVARAAETRGFATRLLSEGQPSFSTQAAVLDRVGELGIFYRLARLAVIGGSLAPGAGGHNPLEPARLGCPFVSGPSFANWPVYRDLEAAGATRIVAPGAALADVLREGVEGSAALTAMAERARTFVAERDGQANAAVASVLEALLP